MSIRGEQQAEFAAHYGLETAFLIGHAKVPRLIRSAEGAWAQAMRLRLKFGSEGSHKFLRGVLRDLNVAGHLWRQAQT
jgi:hypothetical protein